MAYDRDAVVQTIPDKQRSEARKTASLSGPLSLPTRASANSLSAPIRSSGGMMVHLIITAHVHCLHEFTKKNTNWQSNTDVGFLYYCVL